MYAVLPAVAVLQLVAVDATIEITDRAAFVEMHYATAQPVAGVQLTLIALRNQTVDAVESGSPGLRVAVTQYIRDLVGIDHVGFGPDTLYGDHVGLHDVYAQALSIKHAHARHPSANEPEDPSFPRVSYVQGLENPTEGPHNILRWLVKPGYSNEDIAKAMGGERHASLAGGMAVEGPPHGVAFPGVGSAISCRVTAHVFDANRHVQSERLQHRGLVRGGHDLPRRAP